MYSKRYAFMCNSVYASNEREREERTEMKGERRGTTWNIYLGRRRKGREYTGGREKRASLACGAALRSSRFTHRVSRNWADTSYRTDERTNERANELAVVRKSESKGVRARKRNSRRFHAPGESSLFLAYCGVGGRSDSYAASGDRFRAACLLNANAIERVSAPAGTRDM